MILKVIDSWIKMAMPPPLRQLSLRTKVKDGILSLQSRIVSSSQVSQRQIRWGVCWVTRHHSSLSLWRMLLQLV